MSRDRVVAALRALGACDRHETDAIPWALRLPVGVTEQQAWSLCERPDWLLWLIEELCERDRLPWRSLVAAVAAVAGVVAVPRGSDERVFRCAVEVAREVGRGGGRFLGVALAMHEAHESAVAATAFGSASPHLAAYYAAALAVTLFEGDRPPADKLWYARSAVLHAIRARVATLVGADAAWPASVLDDAAREVADAVRAEVPWDGIGRALEGVAD